MIDGWEKLKIWFVKINFCCVDDSIICRFEDDPSDFEDMNVLS